MNIIDLLITIVTVYGVAHILKTGSIFSPLRDWLTLKAVTSKTAVFFSKLIQCYVCLGAEIGFILGLIYGPYIAFPSCVLNLFFYGATTHIINSVVMFLGGGYDPNRIVTIIEDKNDK